MDMPLTICIIAKNEEKNLRQCLQGIVPLQCNIVFVDTGSTDSTIAIASQYTDRIFSFPWKDDFSAARNFAAQQSDSDWILSLDCDEFLTEADLGLLTEAMQQNPDRIGVITLLNPYEAQDAGPKLLHEHLSRLYNRTIYHFQGRVHETLTPINANEEPRHFEVPLTFYHAGYQSAEMRRAKAERDLRLLQTELSDKGPDPYIYFQMGQSYAALGDKAFAAHYFDKGLSMDVDPRLYYVQEMIEAYGYALLDLGRYEKALGLEAVYDSFAGRADFLFLMGLIYMNNGRFDDAIAEFTKATQTPVYCAEGVNSYSAHYNIGVILEVTGRIDEAVREYESCGNYRPALSRLEKLATVSR
ncbi:MAG: glycosyltransferase [Lachnospiraceae bacterium]|nr:glycosyltransferase [Lachnospiraceae bacterium]